MNFDENILKKQWFSIKFYQKYIMYIPSSPSSSLVGLLRRSVRSMVLGGGVVGVILWLFAGSSFHFYQWPLSRGLEPTLEPPTGGTIYLYLYVLYLRARCSYNNFPSFWVRLGAAETINVSHVRANVGCASYVDFCLQILCIYTNAI
jgi:hypothetical protein